MGLPKLIKGQFTSFGLEADGSFRVTVARDGKRRKGGFVFFGKAWQSWVFMSIADERWTCWELADIQKALSQLQEEHPPKPHRR